MTEQEAFIAAIKANRDDDSPRMAYADWLDEHDQPKRAEFIRVQCRVAFLNSKEGGQHDTPAKVGNSTLGTCPLCLETEKLRRRERELLEKNFCDWVPLSWHQGPGVGIRLRIDKPIVVEFTGSWVHAAVFDRGFISWLSAGATDWFANADEVVAAQPIEKLTLTTWPELDWIRQATRESDSPLSGALSESLRWADVEVGTTVTQWKFIGGKPFTTTKITAKLPELRSSDQSESMDAINSIDDLLRVQFEGIEIEPPPVSREKFNAVLGSVMTNVMLTEMNNAGVTLGVDLTRRG